MKIKIEVDIVPFKVPRVVQVVSINGVKQDGFHPPKELPLSELDDETLLKLCTDFQKSVFKNAGRLEMFPQKDKESPTQ